MDADEDGASETAPTPVERRLFTRVIALAEQMEKPVRLMIVPSHDVFEAIVTTVMLWRLIRPTDYPRPSHAAP